VLTVYLNRCVALARRQFLNHTTAKGKSNRIRLWNAMVETLKAPDEVWLNSIEPAAVENTYSNYNLIRF
jgi:hypothetical protein